MAQQDPPPLLLKQLDVVLNALSMLSGEAELWTMEGIDANAVWPLSLLALLLLPLLLGPSPCSHLGLPCRLLLLWLLTTRVRPVAAKALLSPSLLLLRAVLVLMLMLLCWPCCFCLASASAHEAFAPAALVVPGALLLSGAEWLRAAAVGLPLLESSPTVLVGGGCRKPAGMRLPLLCRLSSLLRGVVVPLLAALLVPSQPGAVVLQWERHRKHPDMQDDAVLALLLLLLLLPGVLPELSPLLLLLQAAAEASVEAGRWLRAREVRLEAKNFHCWVLPATLRAPLLLSPAWFAGCP